MQYSFFLENNVDVDEVNNDYFVIEFIVTPIFNYIEKIETFLFQLFDNLIIIPVNKNLLNKLNNRKNIFECVNMFFCEEKLNTIDNLSIIINSNIELGLNLTELEKCFESLFLHLYINLFYYTSLF